MKLPGSTMTLFSWALLVLCRGAATAHYTCDESKCRAERIHPWVDDDTEYTCWVAPPNTDFVTEGVNATAALEANLLDPEEGYCADGYVGRIVQDVPMKEVDGELRYWFTCCPADSDYATVGSGALEVYQTCSDTACSSPDWEGGGNCWADGFQEPMSCGSRTFRHPRFTGLQSLIYVQFICCTSPQSDDPFMDELHLARVIWITLSSLTLVVCVAFIVAILTNERARVDSYNLYLVFLAAPDALANIMILVRNALAIPGVPVSPTLFIFLASFEYFYAASNMWLNAVIVRQIYMVLRNPDKKIKIPPPSNRLVCKQASVVYAVASIVFGWAFYLYMRGLVDFSLASVVKVWIATRVVMVSPPLFYVLYICYDVWNRNLLPISGRTRVLALYFLRVIVVFLLTWVPYFILYELAWNITYNQNMVHTSYYLGSIQGTVSVLVAMGKPDVKQACVEMIYRLCGKEFSSSNDEIHVSSHAGIVGKDAEEGTVADMFKDPAEFNEWYTDDVWADMDIDDIVGCEHSENKETNEKTSLPAPKEEVTETEQHHVDGEWVKKWYMERFEKRMQQMGTRTASSGSDGS